MSASKIGQDADTGCKNTEISMTRAFDSSKLKPPVSLCGIQAINAASAVSFGHHP
jgi:hypothetical protein